MIRIQTKDFKALLGQLYKLYGGLYEKIKPIAREDSDGGVTFDETKLGEAYRKLLAQWIRDYNVQILPAVSVLTEQQTTPEEDAAVQAVVERAKAEDQAKLDAARVEENKATARLDDWAFQFGLLLNDYNLQVLRDHFQQNSLAFNVSNIDAAVNALKEKLQWVIWSPMLRPAEEPQPEEVLGRLKNGEKQLPLASSEATLRKASRKKVADWLERTREATNQRYIRGSHSHGVGFITPTMN